MQHIFKRVPSKISTIAVAFDGGARSEEGKYPDGIAHFLEHACFKGTKNRNYLALNKEVALLGGRSNAFTSNEMVVYYISVPFENTEKAMDILQDMVFDSIFPEDEIIKEKEVVKEEELSSKEAVEEYLWDLYTKDFYQERAARPVIGTQESISSFTREHLVNFHNEFYASKNGIVALCSNHSDRKAAKLLEKYFGQSTLFVDSFKSKQLLYKDSRSIKTTRQNLEHSHVMIGFPAPGIQDSQISNNVLLSILGSGMDSRLFTEVRENHGLCYSIYAHMDLQKDWSSVIIESSTRSTNLAPMVNLINEELAKITTDLVEDEELERAKNKIRTKIYSIEESSHSLALQLINEVFSQTPTLKEVSERIKDVSKSDVLNAAQLLFNNSKRLDLVCDPA